MKSILITILLLALFQGTMSGNSTTFTGVKASDEVTVSGVSSGGFMSAQMLVAFSETIKGAGLFAAGPYFCTRGTMMTIADCMTTAVSIVVEQLILAAKTFENTGFIDKMSNLKNSKVYIYSGTKDNVVWPDVVKKNEEFFKEVGASIKTEYSIDAEHSFPTDFFGNECEVLGSPFISNCDFKGAKFTLEHVMDTSLKPKVQYKKDNIKTFDQSPYNPGPTSSLGDSGVIYVPDGCKANKKCPLHVAFHGCAQTIGEIGLDYVKGTGFLGLAEANDFIILFPQVKVSNLIPLNPKGCWDWWGYSEAIPSPFSWTFPTKSGTQMKAVHNMIKDLKNGDFAIDDEFMLTDIKLNSY